MDLVPQACVLPVAQPSPAGHTRAARNLGRQALPRYTRIEHKQDADQRIAGCNRRTTALRARSGNRHQRGDLCPQIIRKEFLGHASKLTPTWLTKGFVRRSKLLDRAQRVDDLITTLKALLPELDATDAAIWGGLRAARVTPPGAVVGRKGLSGHAIDCIHAFAQGRENFRHDKRSTADVAATAWDFLVHEAEKEIAA